MDTAVQDDPVSGLELHVTAALDPNGMGSVVGASGLQVNKQWLA